MRVRRNGRGVSLCSLAGISTTRLSVHRLTGMSTVRFGLRSTSRGNLVQELVLQSFTRQKNNPGTSHKNPAKTSWMMLPDNHNLSRFIFPNWGNSVFRKNKKCDGPVQFSKHGGVQVEHLFHGAVVDSKRSITDANIERPISERQPCLREKQTRFRRL